MTDNHPRRPVRRSISPPGECIPAPADGDLVRVKVRDGEQVQTGLLLRWKNTPAAWIWADTSGYRDLTE